MDICGRVWVGVAYYINLVFVRFLGLDVSELSLTTDHFDSHLFSQLHLQ